MGIAAQSPAACFLPIAHELIFTDAPLQPRSGIDSGRRVRLKKHQISTARRVGPAEKMVEPRLEDFRGRRIGRHVPAKFAVGLVRTHHHRERVPTHDRGQALLQRDVTRVHRLLGERHSVLIRGIRHHVGYHAELLRLLLELGEQEQSAVPTTARDGGLQGLKPLAGLFRITIVGHVHADTLGRRRRQIMLIACHIRHCLRHTMLDYSFTAVIHAFGRHRPTHSRGTST